MDTHKRHVMVFLGSLFAAAVLSGVAAAGNPHGTPPGQAANAQTSSSSSAGVKESPGQAKKQTGQAKNTSSSSSSAGVKPSSTTQHNTNAAAGSNQTKLYGNGKTAGQIAMNNGASADTNLYGPGNSQPHKVAVCSKNGKTHTVDVHALKAHRSASCAAGSNAAVTGSASNTTVQAGMGATLNGGASAGARIHFRGAGAFTPPRATRHGGVLGAQHAVTAQAKPAHAVVGSAIFTG